MENNNKWRLVSHSHQIADTGDYDGYWELTSGTISLITKDEPWCRLQQQYQEERADSLIALLNTMDCKWENWNQDAAEYELSLEKEHCKKWKEIAQDMYIWLDMYKHTRELDKHHPVVTMCDKYEELEKQLP